VLQIQKILMAALMTSSLGTGRATKVKQRHDQIRLEAAALAVDEADRREMSEVTEFMKSLHAEGDPLASSPE